MSTRAKTRAADHDVDGDGPEELHYVRNADIAAGRELGVEVPAVCGEWLYPWEPDSTVGAGVPGPRSRVCPRCQRLYSIMLSRG